VGVARDRASADADADVDADADADSDETGPNENGWVRSCPKCGHAGGGSPNCCGEGGEWENTCVDNEGDYLPQGVKGEHTWDAGFNACNDPVEVEDRQAEAAAAAKAAAAKSAAKAAAKEKAEERKAAKAKEDLEIAQAKALADQLEAEKQAKVDAAEAAVVQEEARAAAAKEADIVAGKEAIREEDDLERQKVADEKWEASQAAKKKEWCDTKRSNASNTINDLKRAGCIEGPSAPPAAPPMPAPPPTVYHMSSWANTEQLSNLFRQGIATNDLRHIGLTVHCFDDTEDYPSLYKPCKTAWCYRSSKFWSASIINSRQRRTFGDNGIIFTPSPMRNELLCSFTSDSGTLNAGCQKNKDGKVARGYEADRTEDMMRWSMKYSTEYNEALINSTKYSEQLPASVAAIVYGLRGADSAIFDKVKAVKTYVSFLDEYNLNESQVPLLRASRSVFTNQASKELVEGEPIFIDESAGARAFLEEHPYSKYRAKWQRAHPFLADHPNETRGYYRRRFKAEREQREKLATQTAERQARERMDRSRKLRERRGREGRKILDEASKTDPGVGSGGATDELIGRHHRAPRVSKTKALDDFLDTPDEDEAEAEAEAEAGDGDGRAPWPTDHLRHSKRKMDEFLADAPAPAPGGGLLDRFLDPDPAPARTMSGEDGDGFEHGDSLAELESSYQAWRLSSKFRGSKDEDEAPAPAAAAAPAPSDDLAALEELQADYAYQAWRLSSKFRGRKDLVDGVTSEAAGPSIVDAPEATPTAEQEAASEEQASEEQAAEQARDAAEAAQESESEPAQQEAATPSLDELQGSAPSPPPGMGSPCKELPCPDDHDDHDHDSGGHGSPNRTHVDGDEGQADSLSSSPEPRKRQRFGVELPEPELPEPEVPEPPEFSGWPPKPSAPAPPSPNLGMGSPCTKPPCLEDHLGSSEANITEQLHRLIHGDAPHGSLAVSPSLLVASGDAIASQHAEEHAFARRRSVAYTTEEEEESEEGAEIPEDTDPFYAPAERASLHRHHSHHSWHHGGSPELELG